MKREKPDAKKGGALKVNPIDGCYLRVRHERLLGDKRKTANAIRTGWVTNITNRTPNGFTRRRRDSSHEKLLEITEFVRGRCSTISIQSTDIQIRHITFAPYHMHTMFGAPVGDFCHGLLNPDPMGPNWLGPKGFRDMSIGIDGLYLGGAGCRGCPGITFIPGYNGGYRCSTTSADVPLRGWRLRATPLRSKRCSR